MREIQELYQSISWPYNTDELPFWRLENISVALHSWAQEMLSRWIQIQLRNPQQYDYVKWLTGLEGMNRCRRTIVMIF